MTNDTFVQNSAGGAGGGIFNGGQLNIVNSTFSGNSASANAGGGIYSNNTLTVTNSTFSGNGALQGGVIASNSGAVSFTNAILANSTSGGNCFVGSGGTIVDGGRNISDDGSCGFAHATGANGQTLGDNVNALLSPSGLQDNGGPTRTIGLQSTSPAIDAIPTGSANCPGADQRGAPRPDGFADNFQRPDTLPGTIGLPDTSGYKWFVYNPLTGAPNADVHISSNKVVGAIPTNSDSSVHAFYMSPSLDGSTITPLTGGTLVTLSASTVFQPASGTSIVGAIVLASLAQGQLAVWTIIPYSFIHLAQGPTQAVLVKWDDINGLQPLQSCTYKGPGHYYKDPINGSLVEFATRLATDGSTVYSTSITHPPYTNDVIVKTFDGGTLYCTDPDIPSHWGQKAVWEESYHNDALWYPNFTKIAANFTTEDGVSGACDSGAFEYGTFLVPTPTATATPTPTATGTPGGSGSGVLSMPSPTRTAMPTRTATKAANVLPSSRGFRP